MTYEEDAPVIKSRPVCATNLIATCSDGPVTLEAQWPKIVELLEKTYEGLDVRDRGILVGGLCEGLRSMMACIREDIEAGHYTRPG